MRPLLPQDGGAFPDDPEGKGSWALGAVYAVVGAPFGLGAILGLMSLLGGRSPDVGNTVFLTLFGGLVASYCAFRFRYWWGTALARRVDRQTEARGRASGGRLEAASAGGAVAVPSRLEPTAEAKR